ncbi:hypothetical protein GWO43_05000 [candidate division KSB1 bacterium]|nr:hypothetical protein [candidate division KSB1 bacterium]NIR71441.1 hypothetical protein [candidate division KSB1 bacterium]NIS23362.1 hypothetical protein [candidate division KSB1 bacterium]NIT70253.1 hypothetical protein [candidate division KSB1 bacterium]NIU23976.1 hypothetical protein [candidate division KSB1 bacterium]
MSAVSPNYGAESLRLAISFISILFALDKSLPYNELIAKCTQKSEDWDKTWREFENRYGKLILIYLHREFTRSGGTKFTKQMNETIKDLRQDVYIKLLANNGSALRNFRGDSETSFRAYLNSISINVVKNYIKSKISEKRGAESVIKDLEFHQPQTTNTSDELEEEFFKESIIEKLRQCYKSRNIGRDLLIFRLICFEGHSAAEIQSSFNFGLSVSGIDTLISRMKKTLKKLSDD